MSTRPKTERRKAKSKNLKTPLPILMKIRKSSSEREKKKRELDRIMGNSTYFSPGKKSKREAFSKDEYLKRKLGDRSGLTRSIGDGSRSLSNPIGKYSNGTLYLSQRDINDITGPKEKEGEKKHSKDYKLKRKKKNKKKKKKTNK